MAPAFNPQPKPTKADRHKQRAAERRQWKARRKICRATVYARAFGCCERCQRPLVLLPENARHVFEIANIHEHPPRSLGGDPLNPDECLCLCAECSAKEHALPVDARLTPPAHRK